MGEGGLENFIFHEEAYFYLPRSKIGLALKFSNYLDKVKLLFHLLKNVKTCDHQDLVGRRGD